VSDPGQGHHAHLRQCRDCGLISAVPEVPPGRDARCPRCDRVLRRGQRGSRDRVLACAIGGLWFYLVAIMAPFMTVETIGRFRQSTLFTGPATLERSGLWEVGLLVLLATVVLPAVELIALIVVLIGLRLRNPPPWLSLVFQWLERLAPWAMVEVYFIGVFVAYTRLVGIVHVDIGMAAYALIGLMLTTVAIDATLDPDAVWATLARKGATAARYGRAVLVDMSRPPRMIGCHVCHAVSHARPGAACFRCGARLRMRRPDSVNRTWALLIAAAILYVPANLYPVMHVIQLGREQSYTILGGVRELVEAGLWPLAALVFIASIVVPLLKLGALLIMLTATHRQSATSLFDRTRLYRVIGVIGRWSMIDIFMVSILVGLVRFGVVSRITSDVGAACFAAVVILTMLATETFDPRLMWDAAGAPPGRGAGRAAATPRVQGRPA
jgi:paraquat-inducible protein A